MSSRNRIAFACHGLVALAFVLFGAVYALSPEIMPYHQEVIGKAWADLDVRLQNVLLAFLHTLGFASIGAGVMIGILLAIPFRRGERWARWTIPLVGLTVLGPMMFHAIDLALATGAATPWPVPPTAAALLLAGFFLSGGAQEGGRN